MEISEYSNPICKDVASDAETDPWPKEVKMDVVLG